MSGPRTPLVLLHGVGLDSSMWEPFLAAHRVRDSREVLTLDLPGHGSRPHLTQETSLAEMAEDIVRRLPPRSHLLGFSLGAMVAQYIAYHHAERVSSLICVSSVCRRTEEEREAVLRRLEVAAQDFRASASAALERWFPTEEGSLRTSPAVVEQTRQVLMANDTASYLNAYRVFATADAEISPLLGEIEVPTLAITGSKDPGSTPEMTHRLADAIPGAAAVVIPGVRHMFPVQEPDILSRHIIDFLSTQAGAS